MAGDSGLTEGYFVEVMTTGIAEPLDMMISVVSYGMSGIQDLEEDLRVFVNVIPNHEESSFDVISFQNGQYLRCDLRYRTIIKSQVYSFTRPECGNWVKLP